MNIDEETKKFNEAFGYLKTGNRVTVELNGVIVDTHRPNGILDEMEIYFPELGHAMLLFSYDNEKKITKREDVIDEL